MLRAVEALVAFFAAHLAYTDNERKGETINALARLGPAAKAALPKLVELQPQVAKNRDLEPSLRHAIEQIDPETAKKLWKN